MIRLMWHLLVALAVMAITANYFANSGQGYGVPMHPYVFYGVGLAVVVVPLFWFVSHFAMAVIMGVSGGGMMEGLRLGFILGLGMALGSTWLNVAALGAGLLLGQAPTLWWLTAFALAGVLCALNWVMHYFWRTSNPPGTA